MKPLKLRMQAFGAFVDEVEIDFTVFGDHGLFLVTGLTGSGKTTIFDGIAFALYGKASGSSRDNADFRSDFAPSTMPSFVELSFVINRQTYTIKRTPRYFRDGVKTENKTTALLTLPNGEIVDGITNVDEKIKSIIGLSESQFRQIIMIAQGEYTKLLLADSKEKEEIFRNIFHTESYQKIGQLLADRNRKISLDVSVKRSAIDENISGFDVEETNDLYPLIKSNIKDVSKILELAHPYIEQKRKELELIKKDVAEKDKQVQNLDRVIESTKAINKDFEELDKQNTKYTDLLKQADSIQILKDKLSLSSKAKNLKDLLQQREQTKRVLLQKNDSFISETTRFNGLDVQLKAVKESFDLSYKQKSLNTGIALDLQKFKDTLLKAKASSDRKVKLIDTKGKLSKLKSDQELIAKNLLDKQEDHKQKIELQKSLPQLKDQLYAKQTLATETEKSFIQTQESIETLKIYVSLITELKTAQDAWQNQEKLCVEKEAEIAHQESTNRANALGIIVSQLKNSEPCPVCGSLDHPHPAQVSQHSFSLDLVELTKQQYKILVSKREEIQLSIGEYKTRITTIEKQWLPKDTLSIESKETISISLMAQKDEHAKLVQQIQKEVIDLKARIIVIEDLSFSIEKLNQSITLLQAEQSTALTLETQLNTEVTILETKLKENEFTYPQGCASPEELEAFILRLETKIRDTETAYEAAEAAYKKVNADHLQSTGTLIEIKKDQEHFSLSLIEHEKMFKDAYLKAGFETENDYHSKVLSYDQELTYQKEVDAYIKELAGLESSIKDLKSRLKDKKPTDVSALSIEKDLALAQVNEIRTQATLLFSKLKNNEDRLNRFVSESTELVSLEKQYVVMETMSKLANGQNAQKITLERFVLALYFDSIIEAANYRFAKITNNRFQFERRDKRKGNAQQGLDLDIFDQETGKSRDVKTLSGGESFKASLSLALGCSDIIQTFAGGVELNTLFIDEGFGSLDPDSLEMAISTLVYLNNDNKLIGVISHVQELKDRINAKVIVTKGKSGSTITLEA
jgi:DNA repair protein SbcC/Rad50